MKPLVLILLVCASAPASEARFAWDPNSEPDLAGYRLHHGLVSRAYDVSLDVGMATEATVSDLSSGTTYYFAVTAYDTGGLESLPSDEVSVTVLGDPSVTPPIQPYYPLPRTKPSPGSTVTVTTGPGGLMSWIGAVQVVTEILTDHFLRPSLPNE